MGCACSSKSGKDRQKKYKVNIPDRVINNEEKKIEDNKADNESKHTEQMIIDGLSINTDKKYTSERQNTQQRNHDLSDNSNKNPNSLQKNIKPSMTMSLDTNNIKLIEENNSFTNHNNDRYSTSLIHTGYEIIFDEKINNLEDEKFGKSEYYSEMNELQSKDYEDFLEKSKNNSEDLMLNENPSFITNNNTNNNNSSQVNFSTYPNINNNNNSSKTSTLMEWSKILHKHFSNYEKSSINIHDNKNKLQKVYQIILTLKERNWYEEILNLYKERYTTSKNLNNMQELTFDRKIIQLQEQFRWLINAVANIKLNTNSLIGVSEFPPIKTQSRVKNPDSTTSNNTNKNNSSQSGSDNNPYVELILNKPPHISNSHNIQTKQIQSSSSPLPPIASITTTNNTIIQEKSGLIFMKNLPSDIDSPYWQTGFIWKGVYFRLYSKKESQILKREIKLLKHLAIEYLQTDSTLKFTESYIGNINTNQSQQNFMDAQSIIHGNESGIHDISGNLNNRGNNQHQHHHVMMMMVSVVLPFITCIEGSSWVLLASAIIPTKKDNKLVLDDLTHKLYNENLGLFKNTFLLCNTTQKNFKLYSKSNENLPISPNNSNPNNQNNPSLNQIHNTSTSTLNSHFGAHSNPNNANNSLMILCNANILGTSLPAVNTMFILSQDIHSNIIYMEFPKNGIIEYNQLKKLLGYHKLDINTNNLKKNKDSIRNLADHELTYQFESIQFKRMGWKLNMIYVNTKDPNFQKNQRAMNLLWQTHQKKPKEIRGNVIIFGYMSNTNTIIHPYFLSDSLISSNFMEPTIIDSPDNIDSPDPNSQHKAKNILHLSGTSNPQSKFIETNTSFGNHQFTPNFNRNPNNQLGEIRMTNQYNNNNTNPNQSIILGQQTYGLQDIGSKINTENDSFKKDWTLNASFRLLRCQTKEEKKFTESFFPNFIKSLDFIINKLETTDDIINYNDIRDLFYKKGVNMRYEWIIYIKLCQKSTTISKSHLNKVDNNHRMKIMIGLDILLRTMKKSIDHLTSKKFKVYKKHILEKANHHHHQDNVSSSVANKVKNIFSPLSNGNGNGGNNGNSNGISNVNGSGNGNGGSNSNSNGNGNSNSNGNSGSNSGRGRAGSNNTHLNQNIPGADNSSKKDENYPEKYEFFTEIFFKKTLSTYINYLIKCANQGHNDELENEFYTEISTNLFLNRMRIIEHGRKLLDQSEYDYLLSSNIIKDILNYPFLYSNLFLDGIQHHFNLSINYDLIRQIRNDKYTFIMNQFLTPFKYDDLTIIFKNIHYITLRERSYIMLLKLLPSFSMIPNNDIEFNIPSALYKMRRVQTDRFKDYQPMFDCYLKEYYELPNIEILNDWIVLLDSIFNGLYSPDGEHNFLLEVYILQMVLSYFNENDDQASYGILEKIYGYLNGSPVCSPELTITIHTWFGILSENKLLVECEQSYMMALLTLHKLYGDPRGRGSLGIPWELFITWRLSILCRLQGKIHDAEYMEELFDAALLTLKDNGSNKFYYQDYTYNDPLKNMILNEYKSPKSLAMKKSSSESSSTLSNFKNLEGSLKINSHDIPSNNIPSKNKETLPLHPFTHWISHLDYNENCSKIDIINMTFTKTHTLLKWIINHSLIFHNTNTIWDTAYLRDFYLSLMQNSYTNTSSVSSLSNYSLDRQAFKDKNQSNDDSTSSKQPNIKFEKNSKKMNQGGNLVYTFEKESSTLNKRELNGIIYTWGLNTDGQVGVPTSTNLDDDLLNTRKLKSSFPRLITSLKDTIITNISSGRVHSLAITINKNVLAWGSNNSLQLGLGEKAPNKVFIPTLIPNLHDIKMISCGTEHTVALSYQGIVYSWGQGEGGLLGHGNTETCAIPKVIEGLRTLEIKSVICGGLHTIALTKTGICYSWGRGEGGQLGIPLKELIHNPATNDVYSMIPKQIRSSLEGILVTQIACGDAHSLALTQTGAVYGWGYTNSGQLGLGISGDDYDVGDSSMSLQIRVPTLIDKLNGIRICEIFAGSTFSFFKNDRKELFACGLNDYYQLGLEKNTTRIKSGANNQKITISSNKSTDCAIPKKLDCFTSIPVIKVACGENHAISLGLHDKYHMLFAWGMQKQGQLGLGEINANSTLPRPIPCLQDVMIQNMACGAYHSLVVLGDTSKSFNKILIVDRLSRKTENHWNMTHIDNLESKNENLIHGL